MYVNQIDDIIDKLLDTLYLDYINTDPTYKTIVEGKKINFVEYRTQINSFIETVIDSIDTASINNIINNKKNTIRIMNIIKRYVAYYYFLSIAYYYEGSLKDFRNNLIQYSTLQEKSTFSINNFFNTENNYQLIKLFSVVKDVAQLLLMTELQKQTINVSKHRASIEFLNSFEQNIIDEYLLKIDGDQVVINVHNLIKMIVFKEIYVNYEKTIVFEILNEIEEDDQEYIYIDIVVSNDNENDLTVFKEIFAGEKDSDTLANRFYEMVNNYSKINVGMNVDTKNRELIEFKMFTPIVDDFLRYHKDSEKYGSETDTQKMPLFNINTAKNVQTALLFQQRKKKENTRAQLIISKVEVISDMYSDNIKANKELQQSADQYFQNPFSHRKAILRNYNNEWDIIDKIKKQGSITAENNEYYLELAQIIDKVYFSFKDFKKYGTFINIDSDYTIDLIRYSNIEFKTEFPQLELETRTGITDDVLGLVGLSVGPFNNSSLQCVPKENMLDIRSINFIYKKGITAKSSSDSNGFKLIKKLIKYYYIDTLVVKNIHDVELQIYNNFTQINQLNPNLINKVIYWIYNMETDVYKSDTYENIKGGNFSDTIKFMNSIIYDKIMKLLYERLLILIDKYRDEKLFTIQKLVETFSIVNRLPLTEDDKNNIIMLHYLIKININPVVTPVEGYNGEIVIPEFIPKIDKSTFFIRIDSVNPVHLQPYVKLEAYSKDEETGKIIATKCQHEISWNNIKKIKADDVNKYNELLTAFIEQFVIETEETDYVCKICGQVLSLKKYTQDGSYDSNQRFITAYVPVDQNLVDIGEYAKYTSTINFIDALINRFGFVTSVPSFNGSTNAAKQKRKSVVKNIIDLLIKHNNVNLQKKQSADERSMVYAKRFNISKDLDIMYFFELTDDIISSKNTPTTPEASINKLKYNIILLYAMLFFIMELNGSQIITMASDKYANIYTYLKHGSKLFDKLLINKNINGGDTAPITNYPVLCYLIFSLSYFMIIYKLWYNPVQDTKTLNPYVLKLIITSFVDLVNSISIDAGIFHDDHIYSLTAGKFYTHMNTTFRNNTIIDVLKQNHARYSGNEKDRAQVAVAKNNVINSILITTDKQKYPIRSIPNYRISNGDEFYSLETMFYKITDHVTDITNCENGSYHQWSYSGDDIISIFCNKDNKINFGPDARCKNGLAHFFCEKSKPFTCCNCGRTFSPKNVVRGEDVTGEIDRLDASYYSNLNIIANRKCISGDVHDFILVDKKFECSLCGKPPNIEYSDSALDKLSENLAKIDSDASSIVNDQLEASRAMFDVEIMEQEESLKKWQKLFEKESNRQMNSLMNSFIKHAEEYTDVNTNIDIDKYPVLLKDNVYIITHSHTGNIYNKPYTIFEKDNRILFKENHPQYGFDVYYYTDNQKNVEVFYNAVTLKLVGYHERHREYVSVDNTELYLVISDSIKTRMLLLGYKNKYLDVDIPDDIIEDVNEEYYNLLNGLIRDHVCNMKNVVDKFVSIISRIKNYRPLPKDGAASPLTSFNVFEALVSKYAKLLPNLSLGKDNELFDEWNMLRDIINFVPVNWEEFNVTVSDKTYVSSRLINQYDTAGNLIFYYLITKMIELIDINEDNSTKTNLVQLFIEIIVYLYSTYNTDLYKNSIELKKFLYSLERPGPILDSQTEQTLDTEEDSTITDEKQDELDDIREENEAIDAEGDFVGEGDEDADKMDEGELD